MGYELHHGWLASDGGGDTFEWEGDRVRVRSEETEVFEDGGDRLRKIRVMRARLSSDGQLDGVIRHVSRYTRRGEAGRLVRQRPDPVRGGRRCRRRLREAMERAR